MLARWWSRAGPEPVLLDLLLVCSWPADWDVSEQPFRVVLSGTLAFEAFAQAVNIRGLSCVLRNDAAAAIASFRKGSTQSSYAALCAAAGSCCRRRLRRMLAISRTGPHPLGGGYGASRGGADFGLDVNVDSIHCPATSDMLWFLVARAAADVGWRGITVNAFASESNARAPRFWSRFHEPGAEAINALGVPDWAHSECPACGAAHGEVVFAFPHSSLVRATVTVEKACAYRALCILLVQVAILAQHCGKLLAASMLLHAAPYADCFLHVKNQARFLTGSELA